MNWTSYALGIATPLVIAGLLYAITEFLWWFKQSDWVTHLEWRADRTYRRFEWGKGNGQFLAITLRHWPRHALVLRLRPWRKAADSGSSTRGDNQ